LAVIGRLAPQATLAQARGELRDIARRLSDAHPASNGGWSAEAVPFEEWIVAPGVRSAVWVLLGAVALLLLLACANVANLLVAHAANRRGEMRVRAALGAGSGRLMRQLFTESAVLAVLGTGAGAVIASWAVAAIGALGAGRVPRLEGLQMNAMVLAFACVAGMASCLLFGLAPAVHTARPRPARRHGRRRPVLRRQPRVRHALVVAESRCADALRRRGLLANSSAADASGSGLRCGRHHRHADDLAVAPLRRRSRPRSTRGAGARPRAARAAAGRRDFDELRSGSSGSATA
jgi:hypothetical protein